MYRSLILGTVLLFLSTATARGEVHYLVDFENGDTSPSVFTNRQETMAGGEITAVANPAPDATNPSAWVGRCRVPQGYVRAELSSDRLPFEGETLVYRWSYYLPADFFTDADVSWLVVSQLKTWPCEACNATYDPDICGGCAGIFDDLRIEDGAWSFWWRAEPDCMEQTEPLAFGRWVRFELEIYWTKEQTGWTRLWIDGQLAREQHDMRTLFVSHVSPDCDLYFAVGLYADWSGTKDYLELYIDDIEIEDGPMTQPDAGVSPDAQVPSDAGVAPDASNLPDASAAPDAANPGEQEPDGCGCTASPTRSPLSPLLLAFLVLLLVLVRRRRLTGG